MSQTPGDLAGWLDFISVQHSSEIELGLDRLRRVANQLAIRSFNCPLITVAGTNGKGSSTTALESFYTSAGYRTGCYTSPHLSVFNERVRIDGIFAADDKLCAAFAEINSARGTIPLTYFEFSTLAAFVIFQQHELDIILLEVGLGGRLDATNLFPADVALITSISIDHTDWLGKDRETIGAEKAGIIHPGNIAVISDPAPPQNVVSIARGRAERVYLLNQDFSYSIKRKDWCWQSNRRSLVGLPFSRLQGLPQFNNLAGVLMCLEVLHDSLPVTVERIRYVLPSIKLPGRFQIIAGAPQIILDVSHNPDSVALLADNLNKLPISGRTHAVVAMLKDKDIRESLSRINSSIDCWYVGGLSVPRAEGVDGLKAVLNELEPAGCVKSSNTVAEAWEEAYSEARADDRIVVFGSFHTVGVIIDILSLSK
ncbi:MAG: bifunctional tetrahydrofolate synthase/dihydrofolate synthase [Arenicellales bacterium]